jgi:hypothetical protein
MPDSIVAPFSALEARALATYAAQRAPDVAPHERAAWAEATGALVERGMLERVDRGILVTPEGLAAALEMVPIDVMRTASQSEASEAGLQGAATRPSRAKRTSVGSSSRRGQAPN